MRHVGWVPLVSLLLAGCAQPVYPVVDRPWEADAPGDGVTAALPGCSSLVREALSTPGRAAIQRAASQGAVFTCVVNQAGELALDVAIRDDRPDRVLALLRAGADPNASSMRDRVPLRTAIDKQWGLPPPAHRAAIVALLLQYGADPNVRWCPFETRVGARPYGPCSTRRGVTPLMTAVSFDQVDVVALLLDAGADPQVGDWMDGNAFTFAASRGVMNLLLSHVFPDPDVRQRESLNYLSNRTETGSLLTDALSGDPRMMIIGLPAPPPPGYTDPPRPYPPLDRLHLMLGLGADPDGRDGPGVDWPPLGYAMARGQVPHAEVLLQYGAAPDLRWCTHPRTRVREPGCSSDTGPTPLIWARRLGLDDFTALLLRYGADAAPHDHAGRTSAEYEPDPVPPGAHQR